MSRIEVDHLMVTSDRLREFARGLLSAEGMNEDDANYVAWHLVETNLRGVDSHGIARLPHYVARIRGGSVSPRAEMRLDHKAPSLALLDGGDGLGHLVMRRATDAAIGLARETGAGWVAVRNSSHCGALAPFGLHIAAQGMVGFVFSHVDPMVLPYGASEPFCGTNPICIVAPGNDRTMCLDMATSIVPWNLVANAQTEIAPIQPGWAVDASGADTTDPNAVAALYPVGGHKGSGLGILIDVLCAGFSDSPMGPDIPKMYGNLSERRRLGGLVGAIDVAQFTDVSRFADRICNFAARIGQLRPTTAGRRALFPGEPELEEHQIRSRSGVPIGLKLFAELNELGHDAGLDPLVSEPGAGRSHG